MNIKRRGVLVIILISLIILVCNLASAQIRTTGNQPVLVILLNFTDVLFNNYSRTMV